MDDVIIIEPVENIDESTWNEIKCRFLPPAHLLENPVTLNCGKSACLSCVLRIADDKMNLKCSYCNTTHNLGNNLTINTRLNNKIKNLLEKHQEELFKLAKKDLVDKYNQINSM